MRRTEPPPARLCGVALSLLLLGCGPDPAQLIPRLRDGAPEERRQAAEALGASRGGGEVVGALCDALSDAERSVRAEAARALGRIGAAEGVGCLAAALEHGDLHTRLSAVEALAASGREAAEAMLAALPRARGVVRDKLAAGLGRVGDPRAAGPLLALVQSADGAQEGAARGLVALGRPDLLLPFLAEPPGSPRRRAAARGLRDAYDPASLAALERSLVGPGGVFDADVAMALARRRRLDPLIAVLDDAAAPDAARRAAAEALAGSPRRRAELALDRAVARRDLAAVAGAHLRLIREGREEYEELLVAALAAAGSETMAVRFWECGNPVLREAGGAWLEAHGRKEVAGRWVPAHLEYVILPGGGAPREPEVLWGQP